MALASNQPNLFVDGNGRAASSGDGMRPDTTKIATATLSGSTQELSLSSLTIPYTERGVAMVRIYGGANGCMYGFGAAGAGASFTGASNMAILPPNTIEKVKVTLTDASVYVLQLGAAGTFQLTVLG